MYFIFLFPAKLILENYTTVAIWATYRRKIGQKTRSRVKF